MDVQWALLEPLLPDRTPRRGGQWMDHRVVVNGVMWRTRTGSPWRDLPPVYGRWKTVYNRHRRWSGDGTWIKVLDGLRVGSDLDAGTDDWVVGVDAAVIRAHHHAAGARIPQYTSRNVPKVANANRFVVLLRLVMNRTRR